MANSSATGHSRNVDNLETLTISVVGYGTVYNPAKTSLKLTALQALIVSGRNAIAAEHSAEVAGRNAGNARAAAFKLLNKHITRVTNALRASDASDAAMAAVRALARKIQGVHTPSKKIAEEIADTSAEEQSSKHNKRTQMSFESRLDNLDMFIRQLSSISQYNPNEQDLKITGLTALYNDLKSKNIAAINASTQLDNSRIVRDDILYRNANCVVDIANDTKAYIKSLFGATSPQYKQIAKLKFRRPR